MLSIETLKNIYVYTVGACVLSLIAAAVGFIVTFLLLKIFRYKKADTSS
jgi:hypothetical protein